MPADSSSGLRTQRQGNVLRVTISRAEKGNALTLAMIQALTTIFHEASADETVLRIVLAADGKYFCAGIDLGAHGGILEADAEAKNRQWLTLQRLFQSIERSPKVTIAVISGPAFGAGVGLAFALDMRSASVSAFFHIGEAKLGLAPAVILHLILREWGLARAREAMLTARSVKPTELEAAGIVHSVVHDPSGVQNAVDKYISYFDACGPEALAAIKRSLIAPDASRPAIIRGFYDSMMKPSEEARHGIESFQAGKAPRFSTLRTKSIAKL